MEPDAPIVICFVQIWPHANETATITVDSANAPRNHATPALTLRFAREMANLGAFLGMRIMYVRVEASWIMIPHEHVDHSGNWVVS